MSRIAVPAISLALTVVMTMGCGGDKDNNTTPDYSHLKWDEPAAGPLMIASDADLFTQKIKNGIRLSLSGTGTSSPGTDGRWAPDNVALPSEAAVEDGQSYSQTNVHTFGVDEADRVKYDGEYLYIAKATGGGTTSSSYTDVRVLKTLPAEASAIPVAEVDLVGEGERAALSELYLLKNTEGRAEYLVVVGHRLEAYEGEAHDVVGPADGGSRVRGGVRLDVLDVTAPEYPSLSWTLDVQGSLQDSRLIGDVMYLVTYYRPTIDGLKYDAATPQELQANERLIAETPSTALLPHYRVDKGSLQPLTESDSCYTGQADDEESTGVARIVTVSAFDLRRRQLLSSACITAPTTSIYASASNLYLAASLYEIGEHKTNLHQFSLNSGHISYEGTAAVPGGLTWSNPGLRMHEHDGYLRVVTTENTVNEGPKHRLSVLRNVKGSSQLETVATLPNEQRPKAIGKPNEDIYAVRFLDDRAYIVTFELIDPLYVLDLADPKNPRIAGELEIPGLSNYLHPLGKDYVVSVGLEANGMGTAEGVKIELFDTRDVENPRSIGRHQIGGSGSRTHAAYDLRAFNFYAPSDDKFRFVIPVVRYHDWRWLDTGLHSFEVRGLTAEAAELEAVGAVIADVATEEKSYPGRRYSDRARIHGDTVFYIHENDVWSHFWGSPDQANGPF